jgi:hypothetical protein
MGVSYEAVLAWIQLVKLGKRIVDATTTRSRYKVGLDSYIAEVATNDAWRSWLYLPIQGEGLVLLGRLLRKVAKVQRLLCVCFFFLSRLLP